MYRNWIRILLSSPCQLRLKVVLRHHSLSSYTFQYFLEQLPMFLQTYLRILFKYTITSCIWIKSPNMSFIMFWKIAGILEKPNYIIVASKRPCLVINVVFYSFFSLMQTLLYFYLKSILVKIKYHELSWLWPKICIYRMTDKRIELAAS